MQFLIVELVMVIDMIDMNMWETSLEEQMAMEDLDLLLIATLFYMPIELVPVSLIPAYLSMLKPPILLGDGHAEKV